MSTTASSGSIVSRPPFTPALLLVAFAAAVGVRVAVAGAIGARSLPAALAFAVLLGGIAVVAGERASLSRRAASAGIVAAAVLVLPAVARLGMPATLPAGSFAPWAVATAFVATAEEAFLRGALWTAVSRRHGTDLAIVVAALAFALLHVPLYGWQVVPLDLAVGLVLGVTRLAAGTWTAPAIAHVGADLAGWWLL
jgi:membrane protease YdiL (CAAX protease family)